MTIKCFRIFLISTLLSTSLLAGNEQQVAVLAPLFAVVMQRLNVNDCDASDYAHTVPGGSAGAGGSVATSSSSASAQTRSAASAGFGYGGGGSDEDGDDRRPPKRQFTVKSGCAAAGAPAKKVLCGKACANCSKLKRKCDGQRPCGRCSHQGKGGDCVDNPNIVVRHIASVHMATPPLPAFADVNMTTFDYAVFIQTLEDMGLDINALVIAGLTHTLGSGAGR